MRIVPEPQCAAAVAATPLHERAEGPPVSSTRWDLVTLSHCELALAECASVQCARRFCFGLFGLSEDECLKVRVNRSGGSGLACLHVL